MKKDVVLNEVIKEKGNLKRLLIKICLDFGVDDYNELIQNFFKNKEKNI